MLFRREEGASLACLLAQTRTAALTFAVAATIHHQKRTEQNRWEGKEGKERTIMVRLQSMRQCSVVHNAGMGTGWEQLSRIHFDCVQNASEHNTSAGCYVRMLRRKRIA